MEHEKGFSKSNMAQLPLGCCLPAVATRSSAVAWPPTARHAMHVCMIVAILILPVLHFRGESTSNRMHSIAYWLTPGIRMDLPAQVIYSAETFAAALPGLLLKCSGWMVRQFLQMHASNVSAKLRGHPTKQQQANALTTTYKPFAVSMFAR